jgi:hypothetical protein
MRVSTPALPPGYLCHREGCATVWVREDDAPFAMSLMGDTGSIYGGAAKASDAVPVQGRDLAYVVNAPGGRRWIVRKLRHGGILSSLTRGLFLRAAANRPLNELYLSCRLREMRIPTPEVLAAVVYPMGPFYRAEVVREFVEARGDLASCLFDPRVARAGERPIVLATAGTLVGRLHRVGLDHPDLNLRNILIVPRTGGDGLESWILDLEKCRLDGGLSLQSRRRMLARMRRSASRFESASGTTIVPSEWEMFDQAYREAAHV